MTPQEAAELMKQVLNKSVERGVFGDAQSVVNAHLALTVLISEALKNQNANSNS